MAEYKTGSRLSWILGKGGMLLALLFLAIEFFDELDYAVRGAALPSIREDLGLTYAQVGLLLGLPHIIGSAVEWLLMLLGDTPLRKRLIVGGGVVIAVALLGIAAANSFPIILLAWVISFPASGAFVTLSQATLMDINPGREAQMMARWTFSGSLANFVGPLLLAGGFALAWGWRWMFFVLAGIALLLAVLTWRSTLPVPVRRSLTPSPSPDGRGAQKAPSPIGGGARGEGIHDEAEIGPVIPPPSMLQVGANLLRGLWDALRSPRLLLLILLLQLADLLMDVLTGYLPLYFTDIMKLNQTQVGLLLSITMLASLASDALLIPLLEKFDGRKVVRLSALVVGGLYVGFLLAPWIAVQIGLVLLMKLLTLGWYSVLQGEAYAAVPGRSGTVMALNSLGSLLGGIFPWLVGVAAEQVGLRLAMWLLLLGPLSLLVLLPRRS